MLKVLLRLSSFFSLKKNLSFINQDTSDAVLNQDFSDEWVKKKLAGMFQVKQDSLWIDVFLCDDVAFSRSFDLEESDVLLAYKKLCFFCLKQDASFSSSLTLCCLPDEHLEATNRFYGNQAVQGLLVFIDANSVLMIRIKKDKANKNIRFSDRYLTVLRKVPSGFWLSVAHRVLFKKEKEQKTVQMHIRQALFKGMAINQKEAFLDCIHHCLNDVFKLHKKIEFIQVDGDSCVFSNQDSSEGYFFDEIYSRYQDKIEFQQIALKCANQKMRYGFIKIWESMDKAKKGYVFLELEEPVFCCHLFGFVKVSFLHFLKMHEQYVNEIKQDKILKQMNAVSFPIYVFRKHILEEKGLVDDCMVFRNQEADFYESQGFSIKDLILSEGVFNCFEEQSHVFEFKCVIDELNYYCFYQWIRLDENLILLYVMKICPVNEAAKLSEVLKEEDTISILAAGVAHEIKNPLVPMKSLTQLLESNWEDAHLRKKYCDVILPQIERINELCDSLRKLKIFRPGRKKDENLLTILKESILLIEPAERQGSIVVENHLNTSPTASVDYDQFLQVFQNILQNSVDASPNNSEIRVSFSFEKKMLLICVSDQGEGLSKYELENMFNVFFTTKSSGNGLGMMMVKKILDDHHATIHVASQKGEGCSVTILLKSNINILLNKNKENYVC